VVNFDFPLNPVDYLHRTGRTARAGARGRITSLVARRDQVRRECQPAALFFAEWAIANPASRLRITGACCEYVLLKQGSDGNVTVDPSTAGGI